MTVTWKDKDAADHFVDNRKHIPCMNHLFEAAIRLIGDAGRTPVHIADLGCGSGSAGGAMRMIWPEAKLTMIDNSPPMLERARQTYGGNDGVRIVEGDLGQAGVLDRCIEGPVDVIVSSMAIHHLPRDRQRDLYREVFDRLEPGGVFVNMEHTASGSERTERLWWRWFYDHVADSRNAEGDNVTWQQIRDEYEARQELNVLSPIAVLIGWFKEAGFVDVDCVFKVYEMAVLGGYKPGLA